MVKDRQHRYIYVNPGWLESLGFSAAAEVLGKTALDLFPAWRAERYMQEERRVMEQGEFLDYEELVTNQAGSRELWRSIKSPWVENGRIVGMVNIGVLMEKGAARESRADVVPRLVGWMEKHACEPHSIAEIAEQSNMSRRSMERYFLRKTGDSPARYRMRCRIERAKLMLRETGEAIAEVATACGFCDQSHLTREFRKAVGMTPRDWRDG